MSKANEKAMALFKNSAKKQKGEFKESFEVRTETFNAFESLFGVAKISDEEKNRIQSILYKHSKNKNVNEGDINKDFNHLIELSGQLRAITKQSLILHGERIAKAQDVLKSYKKGAFTAWLEVTYGNRQTPYSILYYYQLYNQLPSPVRPLYQKMPHKAAYLLGAKEGDIKRKIELINNYHQKNQKELLCLIREAFPSETSEFKPAFSKFRLAEEALRALHLLAKETGPLGKKVKEKLLDMKKILAEFNL